MGMWIALTVWGLLALYAYWSVERWYQREEKSGRLDSYGRNVYQNAKELLSTPFGKVLAYFMLPGFLLEMWFERISDFFSGGE